MVKYVTHIWNLLLLLLLTFFQEDNTFGMYASLTYGSQNDF